MELWVAAGCFGTDGFGKDAVLPDYIAGVVYKTVTLEPIKPWPLPVDFAELWPGLYWNNVRLRNPGIYHLELPKLSIPAMLSLRGHCDWEWAELIMAANKIPGVIGYELNFSCPNAESSIAIRHRSAFIRELCQLANCPVYVKGTAHPNAAGNVISNSLNIGFGALSGKLLRQHHCHLIARLRRLGYTNAIIGCGGVTGPDTGDSGAIAEYERAGADWVQLGGYARRNFVARP